MSATASSAAEDPTQLLELRRSIAAWLHIPAEDADLIDFVLAVYKSNEMPGDPLWGLVIDASGGGKTEILRPLRCRSDAYFLSGLTDKTLVSGYRDPKRPKPDPSLLPQINGKVLIIKDLSPLLSMRRETRNAVLADLRDAYDGFTDQGRGNVGRVSFQSRFSVLAASTLAIERFDAVDEELGERFVKFRMRSNQTTEKVEQAIKNMGKDSGMRQEIEGLVSGFLDRLPAAPQLPEVPETLVLPLTAIADLTAIARSHVPRDRQHNMRYLPRPEVGTRLGKELAKLLLALALIREKTAPGFEELSTVARVAEDCMPPNRLLILRELQRAAGLKLSEVTQRTGLPRTTAGQVLQDLNVLRLVEVEDVEKESVWRLTLDWQKRLENLPILLPQTHLGETSYADAQRPGYI